MKNHAVGFSILLRLCFPVFGVITGEGARVDIHAHRVTPP